jgi:hypothetical protein
MSTLFRHGTARKSKEIGGTEPWGLTTSTAIIGLFFGRGSDQDQIDDLMDSVA